MFRFKLRAHTGPCIVAEVANRLRDTRMPWQAVTIEGTEHVYVTIDALFPDAALTEMAQWWTRADLTSLRAHIIEGISRYDAQALNDAQACRESRRVNYRNNRCDCYCCKVERRVNGNHILLALGKEEIING